jgi:preprotein translocase subunit SecD
MLEYARWKYILIAVVLLVGLLLALPNVFGEDFALQVIRKDHADATATDTRDLESYLKQRNVHVLASYLEGGRIVMRFPNQNEQLAASGAVNGRFADTYITALSHTPRTPGFLRTLGLKPMPLGLDLRGGLSLLYQVDVGSAVAQSLDGYVQDARRALSSAGIPYKDISTLTVNGPGADAMQVLLPPGADPSAARAALAAPLRELQVTVQNQPTGARIQAVMPASKISERQTYAIQQAITILKNRVNELGVSEPIIQQQGVDRINVQLPGVSNSAEVKNLLGRTASLEFRLEDVNANAMEAQARGHAPLGDKLYTHTRIGRPVLLKREIIATGDQLNNAQASSGQEGPEVAITLNQTAGDAMLRTTRANLNRPMAVVLIEKHAETTEVNGQKETHLVTDEQVINVATIRGIFSNRFNITGLTMGEARDLALLLRAGSLVTPIYQIEERTVGPSLGLKNIEQGIQSLVIGMLGVFLFMAIYYKTFGLVADLVLLANVVLLTALLSLTAFTLSLPGIAGIILTVGMAVDANVLIYERIREELRKGVTPQAAIKAGFEKAFSAIADSNVTTLIAGVVLFVLGSGPVRGFAIVLVLGIATSLFTSLMGSRALVTLLYGGKRRPARLSI